MIVLVYTHPIDYFIAIPTPCGYLKVTMFAAGLLRPDLHPTICEIDNKFTVPQEHGCMMFMKRMI